MIPQDKNNRRARGVLLAASLFGLAGCVTVAPLEPIKNPPTYFRSDNAVEVEFLSPAVVGIRCAERGTAFYGVPVFHAMACGNGKLVTMPDACATFTGGAYAELVCTARNEVKALKETLAPFVWNASLSAGRASSVQTDEAPVTGDNSVKVEFVHPASVSQRCALLGAAVTDGDEEGLRACVTPERIVLPNPCMQLKGGWYARTLCHEMAHANGWAMDHPGGSFLSDARAGVDPADVPPPRAVMASLSSGAPLRKASESPTYLAFVSAKEAPAQQYAALSQPAFSAGQAPQMEAALRELAAAFKGLQASVPGLMDEAKVFAARFSAPVAAAPSIKLNPGRTPDLFESVRLYEAALKAPTAPSMAAHLKFAALPNAAGRPDADLQPITLLATLPVDLAASIADPSGLVLAVPEPAPVTNDDAALAEVAGGSSDFPERRALAAAHKALVLRRGELDTPTPDSELVEVEDTSAPQTPGLKPPAARLRPEDEALAAAGV